MQKLVVVAALGLLFAPVPSDVAAIGAGSAKAQYVPYGVERAVRRVCRRVWIGGVFANRCYDVLGGGAVGSAWGWTENMSPRRSVPNEWWPYRNREAAEYGYSRRSQLGPRQGPAYFPGRGGASCPGGRCYGR